MSRIIFSRTYSHVKDNGFMIYDPKKIRALRREKGWTITELAKRAGLSIPSVWALEAGETKMPKHETMLRMAAALGVSVAAISAAKVSCSTAEAQETELLAIYAALKPSHRTALAAAAAALLKSQSEK